LVFLKKPGTAHRERINRPQVHRDVVVGDQFHDARQRQVGIGAAEGIEEVDGQSHPWLRQIKLADKKRVAA
jgi:hypothetical protein